MCNIFENERSCRKDSSFCINIDRIVYQKDETSKRVIQFTILC